MGAATGKKPLAEVPIQEASFPFHLMGSSSSEFFPPGWLNLGSWSDEHPCGNLFNGNNDANCTR